VSADRIHPREKAPRQFLVHDDDWLRPGPVHRREIAPLPDRNAHRVKVIRTHPAVLRARHVCCARQRTPDNFKSLRTFIALSGSAFARLTESIPGGVVTAFTLRST